MMVYIDQDFKSIVPAYIKHIRKQVNEINQLLPHRQYKEIERLAIQIKDSGDNYGFIEIGQFGLKLIYLSGLEAYEQIQRTTLEIIQYLESCEIRYVEL